MDKRILNVDEITSVYNTHMIYDFPDNELKPLNSMLTSVSAGIYDCIGFFENNELLGYAFFVRLEDYYLLDYFAVVENKRNLGYGSMFLRLLSEYLSNAKSIIIEVENPKFATSDIELNVMNRRMDFYRRNGFVSTDVEVILFGVRFVLLVPESLNTFTSDKLREIYKSHYRAVLPDSLFNRYVLV